MVVRDEADRLARAIGSFAGLADETIMVDTGSTDGSPEIARSLGARVEPYVWDDDFSGPRNRGFDLATGDWVFVLDADEWLREESREALRDLLNRRDAEGFTVLRRDHTPGGWSSMRFLRLVRRSTGVRLTGRIHEHPDRPVGRVLASDVEIEHGGYLSDPIKKWARNRPLLEKELAERPGQLYYEADLAYGAVRAGDSDWPSLVTAVAKKLDPSALRSPAPTVEPLLETALMAPALGLADEAATLAGKWYPRSVPLLVARARHAFSKGDFAGAAELGQSAWNSWQAGGEPCGISFDPSVMGDEFRLNLGVALAQAGRYEESLAHLDAIATGPFSEPARANASAIRAAIGALNATMTPESSMSINAVP